MLNSLEIPFDFFLHVMVYLALGQWVTIEDIDTLGFDLKNFLSFLGEGRLRIFDVTFNSGSCFQPEICSL